MATTKRQTLLLATVLAIAVLVASAHHYAAARAWLRFTYYETVLGTPLVQEVPRHLVNCAQIPRARRMVAIAFGQSNSANFANARSESAGNVYSFHQGRCFGAVDPMPGADGSGGSVWPRVGDALLRTKAYDNVVFITLGVGSSSVADWAPGGRFHVRLLETAVEARKADLEITHFLWHQGERDSSANTAPEIYRATFIELLTSLRAAGHIAPVYVSLATYCRSGVSVNIRTAQSALVSPLLGTRRGPDSDLIINEADRYDGCHFTSIGLDRFAAAWVEALGDER